ncbi:PREDICTED: putative disease resistance protein RGA1 isoform X2 [Prunus mume]|nr:PREDICTED: putative disease resistance protein RGA1 isoform X2 [Prunus mume]
MEAASIVLSPALQVIFDRLAYPALEAIAADTLGFEDKLNSLRDSIKRVEAILQAAEDQQITNKYVRFWLSNLKKDVSDAEDLLDLSFACYNGYGKSILKGSHAEKIKKAILKLEKTINEGFSTFKFGEPSIGDRRSIQRETGSCILDPKIYGRDDEKEKLVKLLLSSETSQDGSATCIPIIGIGGIGKTTLAQLAYNDERVSKHFRSRMWIFVSENFNVEKIMKKAIELVTKKECKLSAIASLQSRLLELLQENRCLIVLDNVWTEDRDDWKELTPLFRAGLSGCKIIVTTRSQKIPLIMGFPNSPFYLNGLKDDDCWSVFKQEAFQCGEEEKYPNLTRIGKEIIKKIGGVPLAAKCLGRSMLLEREEKKWLFKRDCELWESDESENKLFLPLMLSLPPHLRQCFAFCSLFPKNYEFKKQKLIHLWMAEGFIPEEGSKRPEDIGEEYFSELLWIYFLQEVRPHDGGEIIGYKMNDIIHDLARYVAGKEYVVLEQGRPQNWSPAEIRHASIVYRYGERITIPETLYKAEHLRTLLLIGDSGSLQNGDKIYSSFEYLRVLDLNNCDLVDLPNSLGALICLRYFDLSYTRITQLPKTAHDLFYLQTLNLIGCHNLESLPHLGSYLRHLNLSGCERLTGMPPNIKHLRQLQTLPLFVVPKLPGMIQLEGLNLYGELNIAHLVNIPLLVNIADLVDNVPVSFLCTQSIFFGSLSRTIGSAELVKSARLHMKENLESLGLYWDSIPQFRDAFPKLPKAQPEEGVSRSHIAQASEIVIEVLQPHKNLKKLVINGYPGIKFPHWALPDLVAAVFTNCRSCEYLPTVGNLPLLKTLSLQGMHGVKSIGTEFYGDGTDIWFPSLEELSISDFANLEEWSSANDRNAFRRLKKLNVKICPKLAHIPLPQSLLHLEIQDCNPTLVPIADLSLLSVLILDKIPDLVSLPKGLFASTSLSSLKIVSCPKLHSMPLEIQNLSSLKSLTIRWCEKLSSLPQSLQNLKALESLEISGCGSLTSLLDGGIAGLASLRTLSIENCSELTSLLSSLEQLTLLEDLTIMDCPKLGSFPAGVQHLSSLRSLVVQNCPWFDSLPEGLQNVKTLHCLEISSCDNLTALPEWFKDLASLRSLTIYECPNLIVLPLGFKFLTKLQHLSIQECPELEERCRQGSGEDWLKIAHVPHKYIGSPQVRRFGEASTSGSSSIQVASQ